MPSQVSSTLMITFFLRSSFRKAKANCYLRTRFLTEFAFRDMGLTLLNFILRFSLMIL